MAYMMEHKTCGKIHDAGKVEVLERYADCSRWKCPHCGGWCDDRPIGWGGNVVKIDNSGNLLPRDNPDLLEDTIREPTSGYKKFEDFGHNIKITKEVWPL